jgi:hypothetical protein
MSLSFNRDPAKACARHGFAVGSPMILRCIQAQTDKAITMVEHSRNRWVLAMLAGTAVAISVPDVHAQCGGRAVQPSSTGGGGAVLGSGAQISTPTVQMSPRPAPAPPSDQTRSERAYKCRGPNGQIQFSDTGCFGTSKVDKDRTGNITMLEQWR